MDFAWIERRVPTPDVERIIAGALSDDVDQVGATAHFWYPRSGGIEALPRAFGERSTTSSSGERSSGSRSPHGQRRLPRRRARRIRSDDLHAAAVVARQARAGSRPCAFASVRRAAVPGHLLRQSRRRSADISDKHWVYFYEDGFPFHRLSFPANFARRQRSAGQELDLDGDRVLRRQRRSTASAIVGDAVAGAAQSSHPAAATIESSSSTRRRSAPPMSSTTSTTQSNVEVIRSWLAEQGILPLAASANGSTSTWITR